MCTRGDDGFLTRRRALGMLGAVVLAVLAGLLWLAASMAAAKRCLEGPHFGMEGNGSAVRGVGCWTYWVTPAGPFEAIVPMLTPGFAMIPFVAGLLVALPPLLCLRSVAVGLRRASDVGSPGCARVKAGRAIVLGRTSLISALCVMVLAGALWAIAILVGRRTCVDGANFGLAGASARTALTDRGCELSLITAEGMRTGVLPTFDYYWGFAAFAVAVAAALPPMVCLWLVTRRQRTRDFGA